MVINSLSFVVFFVVVFFLYYLPSQRRGALWQNVVLLLASYFFYGYADSRMLPLLLVVTILFYFIGIGIEKNEDKPLADRLLLLGVVLGVGMLVYFKYTNFFIQSFSNLLNLIGLETSWSSLRIIVPLGISFFTFRLVSYVIEIHRGAMSASRDFIAFASYVAFFPCMLSGPIDRPDVFLPQLGRKRVFDGQFAVDGMRQILWGLFKKMVVADGLAQFVDLYLGDGQMAASGSTTVSVALAYTFQIYADFSGYSDMAIGVGKLLNIRVAKNFNYPFFALNIADFWRRWHISLTTWVTDYVFTPLSFSFRKSRQWGTIVAIIINFLIVGLWHGANWNYMIYGLYHGLLFIPLILMGKMSSSNVIRTNRLGLPVISDFMHMSLTFVLVVFGMLIFRCNSINQFVVELSSIRLGFFSIPDVGAVTNWLFVFVMVLVEWCHRNRDNGLEISYMRSKPLRWSIYLLLILVIFLNGGETTGFIYQVF
ncbi:MAG: MBOAT family protein [Bacteroidales bacterium]|nr:MBOAT family protein [Bacteroidales bacterium]